MEKIFTNTKNSKGNESNKLFISLLTNLILKSHSTKILDWLTQVFTTPGQTLNLHTTTISGIMNLICLIILIEFLTFKVTLNLSSKNTKI